MVYDPSIANDELEVMSSGVVSIAIDSWIGGCDLHACEADLEAALQWARESLGEEEIVKAKELFSDKMGKVFPDEDLFHPRMSYFIDILVFQQKFDKFAVIEGGSTIFDAYKSVNKLVAGTFNAIHSIYRVYRKDRQKLVVRDLMNGVKFQISSRPQETFAGINKSDLIQGFVYSTDSEKFLSKGVIFHSSNVYNLIKKGIGNIAKLGGEGASEFLNRTASCQLRSYRMPHLDNRTVYKSLLVTDG